MENGLTTMIANIAVITELMKIRICDCSERDGDIENSDNSEKSDRNCKNDNDNVNPGLINPKRLFNWGGTIYVPYKVTIWRVPQ